MPFRNSIWNVPVAQVVGKTLIQRCQTLGVTTRGCCRWRTADQIIYWTQKAVLAPASSHAAAFFIYISLTAWTLVKSDQTRHHWNDLQPLTDAGWQRSVQSALSEPLADWLKCRRQRQKHFSAFWFRPAACAHLRERERHFSFKNVAWRLLGGGRRLSSHWFHWEWIESKQRCIPWVELLNLRD